MALMHKDLMLSSCRYSSTGGGSTDRTGGPALPTALSGSCCRLPPAFYGVSIRPLRSGGRPGSNRVRVMAAAEVASSADAKPRKAAKDVKISWGAHNGKTLGMLSDDYLTWLVRTVKSEWGRLAEEVLEERKASGTTVGSSSAAPRGNFGTRPFTSGTGTTTTTETRRSPFEFGFKRYAKENIDYIRSVDLENGREFPECCDEPEFPSKEDFTRLIKAAGDAKNFKEAQRVHARVYNSEFRRNRGLANLLIDMYEKCGALLEARRVFNSVNQPDIGCWNLMLRAYAKHGELQDAREVFDLMPKRDAVSWNLIIRVYENKGNKEEADRLRGQSGLPDSDKGGRVSVPEVKPQLLCFHTEKMSVAFNISTTNPGTPMWFVKNLAICADCHKTTKVISKVIKKQIVVRDATTFHHFENGVCTCGA